MNCQNKNILVLGSNGMLGSMIFDYLLSTNEYRVFGTYRNIGLSEFYGKKVNEFCFDVLALNYKENLKVIFNKTSPNYIINCIGIIKPYCKDEDSVGVYNAIKINSLFPHELSKLIKEHTPNTKIIQIATDCVYDGRDGKYNETSPHNPLDVYGKTKSLGEVNDPSFLNIRCSIIGPELNNKKSLLEWFLNHETESKLTGFTHHQWNGVTTLQFAQFCHEIISNDKFDSLRKLNSKIHYVINTPLNKFELLLLFQKIFETNFNIEAANLPKPDVKRTLNSIYLQNDVRPMEEAIFELKKYISKSTLFNSLKNE